MAYFFTDGQFWSDVGSNALGLGTRALGAVQAVGGAGVAVAGGGLCSTGLGCVIGAPIIVIGADQAVAGARTAVSGEFKDSYIATGAGQVAVYAGASEETAANITSYSDMALGLVNPGSAVKTAVKEGAETLTENAAKNVDEIAESVTKNADEVGEGAAKNADEVAEETAEEVAEESAENGVKVTENADGNTASTKTADDASPTTKETQTKGEPISMLTGEELLELNDFYLESPISLNWKRLYRSSNNKIRGMGAGWTHRFSDFLEITDNKIFWHDDENRRISFPYIEIGERYFHPFEKRTLSRPTDKTFCTQGQDRLTYYFSESKTNKYLLSAIIDEENNRIEFSYDGNSLLYIIDAKSEGGQNASYRLVREKKSQIASIIRIDPHSGDPLQTLVEYTYDDQLDLVAFTDSVSEGEQYNYRNHILIRRQLRSGYAVYFEWDTYSPQARCTRQWGDKGYYSYEFIWDDSEGYNVCRNGNGAITKYRHDDQGRLIEEIDGEGHRNRSEYNEHGWLLKSIDPLGNETSYEYDTRGNLIASINPLDHRTLTEYNDRNQLTTYTDPRGYQWQRNFNEHGKLSQITDPLGAVTKWHYSSRQLPFSIEYNDGSEERLIWNADKRLERSALLSREGDVAQEFEYRYDIKGRVRGITYPDQSIANLTYNNLNQLIHSSYKGETTEYRYDGIGRITHVTSDDDSEEILNYDSMGGLSYYKDKLGAITRWYYDDGLSQPTRRINPDGSEFRYEYDAERNLLALVNENGDRHSFEYDGNERIIAEKGFDGRQQRYRYNAAGHLIHSRDEDGRELNFIRDAMGQLREMDDSDEQVSYFKYNPSGALLTAENPHSVVEFLYDPLGNVLREQQGEAVIQHGYDDMGRRTSTMTPDGKAIDYHYDFDGSLHGVSYSGRQVTQIKTDAMGRVQKQIQGALTTLNDYDPQGRLASMTTYQDYKVGQTHIKPVLDSRYHYNKQGYVEQIEDILHGRTQYHYDVRERLIKVDGVSQENFAFDPASNILSANDGNNSSTNNQNKKHNSTQHTGNRLGFHSDKKFRYDLSGNLIEERRGKDGCRITRYKYNAQNQLVAANKEGQNFEFAYDAFGRRIRKRDRFGETTFVWNGDVLISEQRQNYQRTYLFLPDSFVPLAFVQDDDIFHYRTDHLGTPQEVANDDGEIVWQVRYHAYGNVAKVYEEQVDNPLRFQGQYYDAELGLHYNRHRYYDPSVGRYISQDPIGLVGGENGYAYGVNPVGWIDPLGLKGEGGGGGDVPNSAKFPSDPNKLFPDNYAGLTKSTKPDGKIIYEVQAGPNKYKVEYHPKHGGNDHFNGNHYHAKKQASQPAPGKTKLNWFRMKNHDPNTPAIPGGGTFAPGDKLPTTHN